MPRVICRSVSDRVLRHPILLSSRDETSPFPKAAINMELHHLALGARNVAALAAFYQQTFELPELRRHYYDDGRLRSIWLDVGGPILMIEDTEDGERNVRGVGAGPFLLAFRSDAEQGEALVQRLEDRDIEVEACSDYTIYFRDPENNRVAISSYSFDG